MKPDHIPQVNPESQQVGAYPSGLKLIIDELIEENIIGSVPTVETRT